ncbi:MAG: crossover junction endodeoxyribonuclease RuvC [Candidatus Omnitrophota bacterium]|nr:crossover junction endodeoxyribonuclease RuvC [Candidatus Omnitrophota bacterium]
MRILGIDPGLNTTGYGVIDVSNSRLVLVEAGTVKTILKDGLSKRLNKIYRGLLGLIKEQKPDCMVLEKLYTHYRHPTTACLLGHVRGVICLLATQLSLDFFEYPAKRVRQAILGRGSASKFQAQRMMGNIFHLKPDTLSLDISDALSLAVAHAQISKVKI